MDPNLSKLDPKLREAYERVMNGPTPQPSNPGNQPPPPPTAPNPTGPAPFHINPPAGGPPPMPPMGIQTPPPPPPAAMPMAGTPALDPTPAINSTIAFNAHNSDVNKGTTGVKKGSGGIMKVLMLALVIIAFLVVYTVVWVYLFHLKLPFIG